MRRTIVDTGPLLAVLKTRDEDKEWAEQTLRQLPRPIVTVEPVLTEVAYFLHDSGQPWQPLVEKVVKGEIVIPFSTTELAAGAVRVADRFDCADFADACIVSLYEHLQAGAVVVTLDARDFKVYRTADRKVIRFLAPCR
jgi:predicted nucleic acid-binding protein